MIKSKTRIFIVFIFFSFISCSSKTDKKILSLFEKNHESELRNALDDYNSYCDNNDFFEKNNKGLITFSQQIEEKIATIKSIHREYHNSDIMPRNSDDWNLWMYYRTHDISKKKDLLTKCPFCLAEQDGKNNPESWLNTYLAEEKIDQRLACLLKIMENDEMKKLLSEFEEYVKTEDCFSDKESKNNCFYYTVNNHNYYVNYTNTFVNIMNKIIEFHTDKHTIDPTGSGGHCLFHYNDDATKSGINSRKFEQLINNNQISCCPICFFIYQKTQDGTITLENRNMPNWHDIDLYIWKQNGLCDKYFQNYVSRKEEEKTIAAMPLYTLKIINNEIRSNELSAKKKFDGTQMKIRAEIDTVMSDKIELLYGPYIKLPNSDLEKLKAGQYITFIATMKFHGNNNNSSSSLEDLLADLDDSIANLDSGAMGYSFENCKIIKVE